MSGDQKPLDRKAITERLDIDFALQAAGLGVWEFDPGTGQVQWDDRARELFGIHKDNQFPLGETLSYIHPDDAERVDRAIQWAMNPASGGIYKTIYRTIREDGAVRFIRSTGRSYFNETGQAVRFAGVVQDVTEEMLNRRKLEESEERYRTLSGELEDRVQQRTQELTLAIQDLQRSNDSLRQFAYVASHDLQEPLRKIQSFSNLLLQQYGAQLGTEGAHFLSRMQSAGERMSLLIRDLLAYSQVSTRQEEFSLISIKDVLEKTLQSLDYQIQETAARIEADELPVLKGDESQLGQLFQNLLSNALKFTKPGEAPRIRITGTPVQVEDREQPEKSTDRGTAFFRICVIDQGIGFDNKYQERIFQVFQRLHGKSEYQGTGIGLAICQRVVENHGGFITADSQPGQGATFCVYLPM